MQAYRVVAVGDQTTGCYDLLIERMTDENERDQDERSNGGSSHE